MPTIKDIAREAGVSHGTVSNVINGRGNVSVEKIRLVWQAAEKLGYKVNAKAQSLRLGKDRAIAVMLPGIEYAHWAAMYEVFQSEFSQRGYSVQLYSTRSMESRELSLLTEALNARFSAIITSTCLTDALSHYRAEAPDLPLVFLQREGPEQPDVNFKPDYAPDNLRANNYICHFSVFSRKLLEGEELFRTAFDGAQDHDMILRLTDRAEKIVHVPRLMYYWRSHEGSTAASIDAKPYAIEAAKGAVADHLKKHGFKHFQITSTRACATIFRIRYQILGDPKISIVIANKDHVEDLKRCITSIQKNSTWSNYEIIVVENNSTTPKIKDYYSQLLGLSGDDSYEERCKLHTVCGHDGGILHSGDGRISIVTYHGDFNYSAVNDLGASYASGEYILLLNNDTEVITANWMEEMLMYAQREDVGAVGAKLYYADKTIQHAGVVIGLGAHRTAGHTHYRIPVQNLGYMGRLCYTQNVTAVTGACLLVKKSLYEQVGGLDESFVISLNDVDFCLKLRKLGLLNVWTPFAELYHYESISRGLDDQGEKAERYNRESEHFREKWKAELEAGDPYYNPNFSLDRSDYALKDPAVSGR